MNEYFRLLSKIKIHPTLWLVIGIGVLTAHFIPIFMLFIIIFFHELGHALAAQFFSWRIKVIQLLPFGGTLETEEHGNRQLKEDFWVIIFGPLQHIWMIVLGKVLFQAHVVSIEHYQTFLYMNIAICLFNLLPIWPLDGGKLVFLSLSLYSSFLSAHRHTITISISVAGIWILGSSLYYPKNLNLWIMAAFLLFSIYVEWRQRHYVFLRFLLERHYGRNDGFQKLKPIEADENENITKVLSKFQRGCKHPVIVLKNGKERGVLDENEILHAYFTDKLTNVKMSDLLYSY